MKLQGVMLGSENPKALGEFYEKAFGEAGWKEADWYGFNIGGGTLMVGPHSEVKGKNSDAPRMMITFQAQDVKAEFERLKGCGATVVAEPYQPNSEQDPKVWLATVADIDGNYLQISTPWEE